MTVRRPDVVEATVSIDAQKRSHEFCLERPKNRGALYREKPGIGLWEEVSTPQPTYKRGPCTRHLAGRLAGRLLRQMLMMLMYLLACCVVG